MKNSFGDSRKKIGDRRKKRLPQKLPESRSIKPLMPKQLF